MKRRVVVEAPASSANLGAGFDVFAVALREPRDRLTLQRAGEGLSITVEGEGRVPETPADNVAGAVASAIMADWGVKQGVSMTLRKGVPVGAGLGSSAASSVAAAVGTSALFGIRLSPKEVIRYAGVGERLASGAAHYDNATASFAGGFVVVGEELEYVTMKAPKSLALCLVTPQVELPEQKTKYARSLLPREVPLERMVGVTRAASMMVHGFAVGDIGEIGSAMGESPVDERRASMIPGFEDVRRAAILRGAAGVCISGAGPTVLAACKSPVSVRVLNSMRKAFRSSGVASTGFVTGIGGGCRVIEES